MKNTVKFLGIIAMVAIIVFSITSCEETTPSYTAEVVVVNGSSQAITVWVLSNSAQINPAGRQTINAGTSKAFKTVKTSPIFGNGIRDIFVFYIAGVDFMGPIEKNKNALTASYGNSVTVIILDSDLE
jgi:hypothetical protein